MASVNKVILIGNLGVDPELRHTSAGKSVANFRMATQAGFGDDAKPEWHNIVAWEKLADVAGSYLHKGDPVYIEGRLTYRSWEKDGATKWTTEVVAERLQLLGAKPAAEEVVDEPAVARKKPGRKPKVVEVADDDDAPFGE